MVPHSMDSCVYAFMCVRSCMFTFKHTQIHTHEHTHTFNGTCIPRRCWVATDFQEILNAVSPTLSIDSDPLYGIEFSFTLVRYGITSLMISRKRCSFLSPFLQSCACLSSGTARHTMSFAIGRSRNREVRLISLIG